MKKLLLLSLLATFYYSAQSQGECTEIFISEYVEGWSNNKAIELYNPTNTAKNLSNYRLERGSNGGQPGANQKLVLTGTIEPYSTFVVVIDKRDTAGTAQEAPVWDDLQAKADAFECANYDENNTMYFNGNDAMILRNIGGGGNGFVIDRVGRVGEDPDDPNNTTSGDGWNNVPPAFTFVANGSESWTKDHSLIRKPTVQIGDFAPLALFDPSVLWDSIPPVYFNEDSLLKGNWNSLGNHDCECDPGYVSNVSTADGFDFIMFPNPAIRNESISIISKKVIDRYEVLDITGKVIDAKSFSNKNEIEISLSNYNSGLYILKAYSGSDYSTRKMIVR